MSKLNDQPLLLDLDALNVVGDKALIVNRLRWLEMLPNRSSHQRLNVGCWESASCDCRGRKKCAQPIKPRISSLQSYDCSSVGSAWLGRHRRAADQQWPVARPARPRP